MSAADHRRQAEALLAQSTSESNAYDTSLAIMQAGVHASLAISEDLELTNSYLKAIVETDETIDNVTFAPDASAQAFVDAVKRQTDARRTRFMGREFRS